MRRKSQTQKLFQLPIKDKTKLLLEEKIPVSTLHVKWPVLYPLYYGGHIEMSLKRHHR